MTIPTILLSRLALNILQVLTVDRLIYWIDSKNMWYWIQNHSKQFRPFVANRIPEIQQATSSEQ